MTAALSICLFALVCLGLIDQAATASTICPNNNATNMNDNARNRVVNVHNNKRTEAARGQVKNGMNNYNCPQAADMIKMKYDCNLETKAQDIADDCSLEATPPNKRNQGELVFVINKKLGELGGAVTAINRATNNWWSEIDKNGINRKMQYVQYFDTKPESPKSFTQMAWAKTTKIGCGIGKCGTKTFVVCRYKPKGNIVGENVWKIGRPCSSCSSGGCASGGYLCIN
ncbi:SCP-like protein [Oesophagostomum dentatum]|uniref:SCP-like protein n=1 Tax=Oesophagostomum dentatum TaxID=61180 RepID=A0A0B1T120_OESDE|nr:SCP-like protein [Oesophagostomum dentatum]